MVLINPIFFLQFQFTDSERTDVSAQAFAQGMFGRRDSSNVYMKKSSKPDYLLRVTSFNDHIAQN